MYPSFPVPISIQSSILLYLLRDWSLITGRGYKMEKREVKFYPHEKGGGGAQQVLAMLEGGGAQTVLG